MLTYLETVSRVNRVSIYRCLCDCGQITFISHNKFGITKSCGCLLNRKKENSPTFRGYKDIYQRQWGSLERGAKLRNIKFEITKEYVWDIYILQNKKCKLSGLDITFGDGKTWTASIDRIDPMLGYINGNIQILHKDINKMKMDFDQDIFIRLCKLVTSYTSSN